MSDTPADLVRLSKRMSELGLCSRREADEWISKGWVKVDGQVVSELGSKVRPDQKITIDRKAKDQQNERVTIILNKPLGYVSGQAEDGHEPARILITPRNRWIDDPSPRRFNPSQLKSLVPAGRLDINSTGLLVLTQDGRIAKTIIGENSSVEKEYIVRVAMTDGRSNSDHQDEFESAYKSRGRDLPIFSIMFGDADPSQLKSLATLSNAKVFDGRSGDLAAVFRQVKGFN